MSASSRFEAKLHMPNDGSVTACLETCENEGRSVRLYGFSVQTSCQPTSSLEGEAIFLRWVVLLARLGLITLNLD